MSPRRGSRAGREAAATREAARLRRLARSQRLAAVLATQGECTNSSTTWTQAEQRHQDATTHEQAQSAADQVLHLCHDCPVVATCTQWAQADRYSGLAAGMAWVDGQPHQPHTTRYVPAPSPTAGQISA